MSITTVPKTASKVLAFNPSKKLVSMFASLRVAAESCKITKQSVYSACSGNTISAGGMYFRFLEPAIEVTPEDLGELDLLEYDGLCGVERKVFPTTKMTREGMTYNKQPKN